MAAFERRKAGIVTASPGQQVLIVGHSGNCISLRDFVGQVAEVVEVKTTYKVKLPWMDGEEAFWIGEGYVKEIEDE